MEDDYSWIIWVFIVIVFVIWFIFFKGPSDSDIRKECQKEVDSVAWKSQYDSNSTYYECVHRQGLER